jgi:hypothetical protein
MNYQCNKPPARTLFTMTICDKKLYIFGGILTEKFNDLWCIDLNGNITMIKMLENGIALSRKEKFLPHDSDIQLCISRNT